MVWNASKKLGLNVLVVGGPVPWPDLLGRGLYRRYQNIYEIGMVSQDRKWIPKIDWIVNITTNKYSNVVRLHQ